ncbi:MAG: hypothetical protein A3G18_05990 [Rhodospirillales bacterium RIFCSPLOWO2_12_FULL_58_28]|nr:MAG: hypothetical protein A3H92_05995 [Rhodospirillales bacterium RIFCSPLOWO2_02_FULL_58_16]OHC77277.1 MAG: hypothetical protein A3G18_05990 [Rhodospirillales bacterium RIFCSPLOWO2_12_FULL_58_28]
MTSPRDIHLPEVLFEFQRIGNAVRVCAIDPISGTEIVMVGAPGCGEKILKKLAIRKLAYVIAKRAREKK